MVLFKGVLSATAIALLAGVSAKPVPSTCACLPDLLHHHPTKTNNITAYNTKNVLSLRQSGMSSPIPRAKPVLRVHQTPASRLVVCPPAPTKPLMSSNAAIRA